MNNTLSDESEADSDGDGLIDACERSPDDNPAAQPAGSCGCGTGSALLVPLMLPAMGWMRRRKPVWPTDR